MSGTKKRGAPIAQKHNLRFTAAEAEANNANLPEHLHEDGLGADFRVPPPPWDDDRQREIDGNLALLRVDPTMKNSMAFHHLEFARALLSYPDPSDEHAIAETMAELLSECSAEVIKRNLLEIVKMAEWRDSPPHRNYYALRAYYDFVRENGFDPTQAKLRDYITERKSVYPVGLSQSKDWWTMFSDAGLARLVETAGI